MFAAGVNLTDLENGLLGSRSPIQRTLTPEMGSSLALLTSQTSPWRKEIAVQALRGREIVPRGRDVL